MPLRRGGHHPAFLIAARTLRIMSQTPEENLALSRAISAAYGKDARVVDDLERIVPVESSCLRQRRGLSGLRADDNQFVRIRGWLDLLVFLVDNVAATGSTIAAAPMAIGCGTGLVWAGVG